MSTRKPKLLSLGSVPELTPDNTPYQNWKFTFQNFTYGDSAEMGDMVTFTHNNPEKALTNFPYDEAKLRRAEEWSESSEDEDEDDRESKANADASAAPSKSAKRPAAT